jgi:hypothetical protein
MEMFIKDNIQKEIKMEEENFSKLMEMFTNVCSKMENQLNLFNL